MTSHYGSKYLLNGGHDGGYNQHGCESDHDAIVEVVQGEVKGHAAHNAQKEGLGIKKTLGPAAKTGALGSPPTLHAQINNDNIAKQVMTYSSHLREGICHMVLHPPGEQDPELSLVLVVDHDLFGQDLELDKLTNSWHNYKAHSTCRKRT